MTRALIILRRRWWPLVRNGGLVYRPVGRTGEPYPDWVRRLKGKVGRVTSPERAMHEEERLIRRLRPRDNLLGQPDLEEVPF